MKEDIVFKYEGALRRSLYDIVLTKYGNANFSISIEENDDLGTCKIIVIRRVRKMYE